jgi:hypothetical protein
MNKYQDCIVQDVETMKLGQEINAVFMNYTDRELSMQKPTFAP